MRSVGEEIAMIHRRQLAPVLALVAAGLITAAVPSSAGPRLAEVRGHLLLGYAKLFDTGTMELRLSDGLDSAVWLRTLVNWKLKSAPYRSWKLMVLPTARSRFQRGRPRRA